MEWYGMAWHGMLWRGVVFLFSCLHTFHFFFREILENLVRQVHVDPQEGR